jgi:hypothetical protein
VGLRTILMATTILGVLLLGGACEERKEGEAGPTVGKSPMAAATIAPSPTPRAEVPPVATPAPRCGDNAISWSNASTHVGERVTVEGPVVSTKYASSSRGEPTFLNIGKPYPDPGRFTVVIWGENRSNFPESPEDAYEGKNICVSGLIETYQGSPQIIVDSPSDIRTVE